MSANHTTQLHRSLASLVTLLLAAPLLLTANQAHAGTVGFLGASGPGLASMSFNNITTPSPGNDNSGVPTDNLISINQKAYKEFDYIDMEFEVEPNATGAATEYLLQEGVANSTGIDWTDYHMQLGFGIGDLFVPSPAGDGLDFDAPGFAGTFDLFPFTTVSVSEDDIDAIDGVFTDFAFHVFTITLDVPSDIGRFTIRQYPTTDFVPEPAAGVLALLGLLACSGRRRKA